MKISVIRRVEIGEKVYEESASAEIADPPQTKVESAFGRFTSHAEVEPSPDYPRVKTVAKALFEAL